MLIGEIILFVGEDSYWGDVEGYYRYGYNGINIGRIISSRFSDSSNITYIMAEEKTDYYGDYKYDIVEFNTPQNFMGHILTIKNNNKIIFKARFTFPNKVLIDYYNNNADNLGESLYNFLSINNNRNVTLKIEIE